MKSCNLLSFHHVPLRLILSKTWKKVYNSVGFMLISISFSWHSSMHIIKTAVSGEERVLLCFLWHSPDNQHWNQCICTIYHHLLSWLQQWHTWKDISQLRILSVGLSYKIPKKHTWGLWLKSMKTFAKALNVKCNEFQVHKWIHLEAFELEAHS